MAAILSTNMASLYAQRSMASAQAELSGSVEKLSSGKRINSAKDDAAGLGISQSIAGISNINNQSVRNLQNATSLVQTADGALDVVGKMLQRILTLTTQKNDQALNANQRSSIDAEVTALTDEISRIRERTKFNSTGTIFGQTYTFGAGSGVATTIEIPQVATANLGLYPNNLALTTSFISANAGNSTFNISNHGFSDNDRVRYISGTGNPISPLQNGADYYIVNRQANSFQLSLTQGGDPIVISGLGTIGDDYFRKVDSPTIFNTTSVRIEGSSTSVLVLGEVASGWGNNNYVLFTKGSSNVTSLSDQTAYQIASISQTNTITLKNLGTGSIITFGASENFNGSSLSLMNNSKTGTTISGNSLRISGHGFTDGQPVVFLENNLDVIGLQSGRQYYVKSIINDPNGVELSLTPGGVAITLTGTTALGGVVEEYSLRAVNTNVQVSPLTSNPVLPSSTIQISANSNLLSNNDAIIYRRGTTDNINPLVDGSVYYVKNKSGDTFQLSSARGGDAILLTGGTNFTNASFEKVIQFNSESSVVVSLTGDSHLQSNGHNLTLGQSIAYQVSGGTPISINGSGQSELINGISYYAIPIDANRFKLADSLQNAQNGISINLLSDGTGIDKFHKTSSISIGSVNDAIHANATNRAKLGSYLSALSYAIDNLETMSNNLGDAYSRIVDTDFAAETANLTKNKILQEASAAMLAQANQMPNVVLSLLK